MPSMKIFSAALLRPLLFTAAIFFAAQVVVTLLLQLLPQGTSPAVEGFLDASLQMIIAAPLVWLLVIRGYYRAAVVAGQKFETILEAAPQGILGVAQDGRVQFANREAQKIFGYALEEMLLHPVERLVPERLSDYLAQLRRHFAASTKVLPMESLEVYGRRKDGSRFPGHLSLGLVDVADEPVALAIVRDVTTQKRTEEELREAGRRLARGMEQARKDASNLRQLTELGGLLQSCPAEEEVHSIASRYLQRLLPGNSGGIFIRRDSGDVLEAAQVWGGAAPAGCAFVSDGCWALRRGQLHLAEAGTQAVRCAHAAPDEARESLCVPLVAHGQAFGILHLLVDRRDGTHDAEGEDLSSEVGRSLLQAVAERVALALANLRLREALRVQSIRDPLTGLYNRRHLDESLQRELQRAARKDGALTLFMVDIDHFKGFNDRFGHDAGDQVLRAVAGVLSAGVRATDIACRFGGEEFCVVLPDAGPEHGAQIVERLRAEIENLHLASGGVALGKVTASFGGALFPRDGATAEVLIKAADCALYLAKAQGRNRVVVASGNGAIEVEGEPSSASDALEPAR